MKPEQLEKNKADTVRVALTQELNFVVDELTPLPAAELGDNSQVFLGTHEGKNIVVKTGDEARLYQIETATQKLLSEHGIPCAETLAFSKKSDKTGDAIVVQNAIPGTSLFKLPKNEIAPEIWRDSGQILRKMNSIPMDGFGRLRLIDGNLRGLLNSWREFMSEAQSDIQYAFDNKFIDEHDKTLAERALEDVLNVELPESRFLHGDFHGGHIFTDGQKITGIIDLGNAKAGDPRSDIAYAYFFMNPQERAHFNDGYGEATKDPMILKYLLLITLHKIEYRHKSEHKLKRLPYALSVLRATLDEVRSLS